MVQKNGAANSTAVMIAKAYKSARLMRLDHICRDDFLLLIESPDVSRLLSDVADIDYPLLEFIVDPPIGEPNL